MNYLIYCFSLLSLVLSVHCNVPVLFWESSSISDRDDTTPALHQLDPDEFLNHVTKKVHQQKPLIIVFLEESLSVEDFSWRNDRGQGSFPQLHNLTSMSAKTEFLTSVSSPMEALQEMSKTQGYEWKKYEGEVVGKPGQIVVVRMDDPYPEEDRPELLSRHDGTIATVYSQLLSKNSHVVAMLTGRSSSWSEPDYNRVRREAEEGGPSSTAQPSEEPMTHKKMVVSLGDGRLLQLSIRGTPEISIDGQTITLDNPVDVKGNMKTSEKAASLIVNYKLPDSGEKLSLTYKFTETERPPQWIMDEVSSSLSGKTTNLKPTDAKTSIKAPLQRSFMTSKSVEFVGENVTLRFPNGFQVQAFMTNTEFGAVAVNNFYLTAPIAMGLFTTLILGLILAWALIMIMDIKTMDRFDDPKGKTITVAQGD